MAIIPLSSTTAAEAPTGVGPCSSLALATKAAVPCSRSCDASVVAVAREPGFLRAPSCPQARLTPAEAPPRAWLRDPSGSQQLRSRARPTPRLVGRRRPRASCSPGSDVAAVEVSKAKCGGGRDLGLLTQADWRKGTQATAMVAVPSSEQRAVFQKPVWV